MTTVKEHASADALAHMAMGRATVEPSIRWLSLQTHMPLATGIPRIQPAFYKAPDTPSSIIYMYHPSKASYNMRITTIMADARTSLPPLGLPAVTNPSHHYMQIIILFQASVVDHNTTF
jgi:hypothetical protein